MRIALFFLIGLFALTVLGDTPYGLDSRPQVGDFFDGVFPPELPAQGTWSVVEPFPELTFQNPLGILQIPGTNEMLVWEREGRIYRFEKSQTTREKFLVLDLSTQCQGWDDSGLLGFAFDPNFNISGPNRDFYVWYTYVAPGTVKGDEENRPPTFTPNHDRLSRFSMNASGNARLEEEYVILDQEAAAVWHNGGGMFFHPKDGFLYVTNGDDADTDNAQTLSGGLFSGILRLDVHKRGGSASHKPVHRAVGLIVQNYFIPNDNPFVGLAGSNEEFFAVGLRSPHRMTLDIPTGRIFLGDIGAGSYEEINVINPTDPTGLNFQWPLIEGLHGDLVPPYLGTNKRPLLHYSHSEGNAVIGGYVYRGKRYEKELGGRYLFADNGTGKVFLLNEGVTASKSILATIPTGPGPISGSGYGGISSFGFDAEGEIYITRMGFAEGRIFQLHKTATSDDRLLPETLSATGLFSNLATLTPSEKLIPYSLKLPFWSDGALKSRWVAVPEAKQIEFSETGDWDWPVGSVFVKHFDYSTGLSPQPRRLETRVLVKGTSGVYGVTYRWRADGSDADRVTEATTEVIPLNRGSLTWYYPSTLDCARCHSSVSSGVLGPRTAQINEDMTYPSTGRVDNQIRAWNHVGLFSASLTESEIPKWEKLAAVADEIESLEKRVKSYLDVNCSSCHTPGSGIQALWDARYSTPLAWQKIINGQVLDTMGIEGAKVVVPRDLRRSLLYQRITRTDGKGMPPVGHFKPDAQGIELIKRWIGSL